LVQHLAPALPWKHLLPLMINLSQRSYKKELLDEDGIPFADIVRNMQELNTINTLLGGHNITIAGFKKLLGNNKTITVCEIGCGGGDNLKAIEKWCKKHGIKASFIGIDLKAACINFAQQQYASLQVDWITSDYEKVNFGNQNPDIIFSSLFCHHFTEAQLATMLLWMKANSSKGFFINDLHRNILAYYFIKTITAIFSKSYLVKNDAPLSVARGFRKNEWINLLQNSGITNYSVKWKWAFRHLIVSKN
jgi:2-polyprenyl-3-methyl-5-hydroxy-6-metoxy-1,4-benzoquinol methylase